MERRVLVAIFLSFIVLYAYQAFFVKPAPKPQPGAASTTATKSSTPGAAAATKAAAEAAPAAPVSTAAALVSDSMERDVRVQYSHQRHA